MVDEDWIDITCLFDRKDDIRLLMHSTTKLSYTIEVYRGGDHLGWVHYYHGSDVFTGVPKEWLGKPCEKFPDALAYVIAHKNPPSVMPGEKEANEVS